MVSKYSLLDGNCRTGGSMVRDLTQLIPGVTAVRVKYPGVNGPDRYKGGIVREVLATQFTYIPGGGLWPEFVRADDEWEIIDE